LIDEAEPAPIAGDQSRTVARSGKQACCVSGRGAVKTISSTAAAIPLKAITFVIELERALGLEFHSR